MTSALAEALEAPQPVIRIYPERTILGPPRSSCSIHRTGTATLEQVAS